MHGSLACVIPPTNNMVNIIENRKTFYSISGALFLASMVMIASWGLKLGIDFTGGSILDLDYQGTRPSIDAVHATLATVSLNDALVQPSGDTGYIIRTKTLDEPTHASAVAALKTAASGTPVIENSFDSIGPTIGTELKQKSFTAIVLVLLAIIAYIAFAFRKVSQPVASWKYGVAAVVALFHDVVLPTGAFALLGHFLGYEVDTLFVTAILTVLGFSVHDTIVVFDRIRENLSTHKGGTFEETVNRSVNETIARSINTSLTVLIVLLAVYLLGGDSTKHFVLVLMLGIVFGTYSSIFIASPLLVSWYKWGKK